MALPRSDRSPPQLTQRALMEFVAGGVAFEFGDPPFPPVCRRRTILTTPVPVPEAAVNEDGGFVFRKKNIRSHKPTPDPSAEGNFSPRTIWHPRPFAFICGSIQSFANGDPGVQAKAIAETMQQRAYADFRRRVFAADTAHVPRTALARETVFVHRGFLPRMDTDAHGCLVRVVEC